MEEARTDPTHQPACPPGTIEVDRREGSADLFYVLKSLGLSVVMTELEYADFRFHSTQGGPDDSPCSVGIERKRVRDLVNSIESGRLSGSQLPGLINTYDFAFLVVEGGYRSDHESAQLQYVNNAGFWVSLKRDFRMIDSYLNTIRMKTSCQVVRTTSPTETANQIYMLWHWFCGKRWSQHGSHQAFKLGARLEKVTLAKPSLFRAVVKELPYIGWERSKQVEQVFGGSLERAMTAPLEDWILVDGITPKRAQEIWMAIRGIRTRKP